MADSDSSCHFSYLKLQLKIVYMLMMYSLNFLYAGLMMVVLFWSHRNLEAAVFCAVLFGRCICLHSLSV